MPLYRWEIIRRGKLLITPKLHDVSQVLYLPFDKNHEPYSVESYDPTQVLRLPLEDPPQEITRDRSGYGNDGTIYGAVRVIGKVRNALRFDGKDDYVEVPHNPTLLTPSALSVACWVKTTDTNGDIVAKWSSPYEWCVDVAGGKAYFIISKDGTLAAGQRPSITGVTKINDDIWHHIVAVWDGAKMYLYVDGVSDVTPRDCDALYQGTTALRLGGAVSLWGGWYEGIIDELRIYNRALSEDEIKRLMYLRGV